MRSMGLTTFLLGAVLVGSALQAARAECWELARVEPDLSLLISGKKRPVPPGIVTANLESDASPQWLRYDNPGDTSGHIGAEVRWSAPPSRFCSGERVALRVRIDNLRPSRKRGNVIASASWGPSGDYGGPRTRRQILMRHQDQVSRSVETELRRGQASLRDAPTLYAYLELGNLSARINYHYRVAAGPVVPGQPVREAEKSEPGASVASVTPEQNPVGQSFPRYLPADRSAGPATDQLSKQQQNLLDDFGPPQAFTRIALSDASGKLSVYDAWLYYDGQTRYLFGDGLLLRADRIEPVAGSVQPTDVAPAQFLMGASREQIRKLLPEQRWTRQPGLEAFIGKHAGELEAWSVGSTLLGFHDDALIFVDAQAELRPGGD